MYLLSPLWSSSRLMRQDCPLEWSCWLLPLTSSSSVCTVVLWLCCHRKDGSQTHWSVVPWDPSSCGLHWQLCPPLAQRPSVMTIYMGSTASHGNCHVNGAWSCWFTDLQLSVWADISCKFSSDWSSSSDELLSSICWVWGSPRGSLYTRKEWYIKLTEYFCWFLVFPKCPFTYLSSN